MKENRGALILLIWILPAMVSGQIVIDHPEAKKTGSTIPFRTSPKKLVATISLQMGIQGNNPESVNRYIENYLNYYGFQSASNLFNALLPYKKYTTSDFTLYGSTFYNFSFTLVPTPNSRIRVLYEYAWTPKKKTSMSFNSVDTNFDLNRNTWGMVFNYYIPAKGSGSCIIGAGIMSHNMTFENFQANATGPRFEVGYGHNLYVMDFDFIIGVDFASGRASSAYTTPVPPVSEIDLTGVSLSIRITPYFGRINN